jgi:flagellar hook-associated protein 2
MASGGVLGLGSGAASSLNQETIDKLKKAESRARIEPLEKKIEGWDKEFEKLTEIEAKVNKLKTAMKNLTLSSSSSNVFESISANTTTNSGNGTASAVFNANDVSGLSPGTIDVYVSSLAKAETSYSDAFADKDASITESGTFTINHKGLDYDFSTSGKTYQELADEINQSDLFIASVEQVAESGNKFKMVIKSASTGTENALTFSSDSLGSDPLSTITELQASKDFIGKIDGLDYIRSSNTITLQGNLTMTAVAVDTGTYGTDNTSTTLTLERDSSLVIPAVNEFVTAYNELQSTLNTEMLDEDSPIYDKSMLRTMMSGIKDKIFTEFGSENKTIFDLGFEVDYSGNLSVNSSKFA